jgi:hypothetical protein
MARTVESLIAELSKFPPEAKVFAYEGEITGLVIYVNDSYAKQGVIYCPEGDEPVKPTEPL